MRATLHMIEARHSQQAAAQVQRAQLGVCHHVLLPRAAAVQDWQGSCKACPWHMSFRMQGRRLHMCQLQLVAAAPAASQAAAKCWPRTPSHNSMPGQAGGLIVQC